MLFLRYIRVYYEIPNADMKPVEESPHFSVTMIINACVINHMYMYYEIPYHWHEAGIGKSPSFCDHDYKRLRYKPHVHVLWNPWRWHEAGIGKSPSSCDHKRLRCFPHPHALEQAQPRSIRGRGGKQRDELTVMVWLRHLYLSRTSTKCQYSVIIFANLSYTSESNSYYCVYYSKYCFIHWKKHFWSLIETYSLPCLGDCLSIQFLMLILSLYTIVG
jgi:hypothetical protein